MSGTIRIETREDGVGLVALGGEHDHSTLAPLEALIATLMGEGYAVVVDLGEAAFLNVPVLGVLKRSSEAAERDERRFRVVLPETSASIVRRLFEVSGVAEVLPMSGSRDEALEALRSG
jgi:anti-anti-sigma factor